MPEKTEVVPPRNVNAREAVQIATDYFAVLFHLPATDIAPEEIERTDDGKYWLITLGYTLARSGGFAGLGGGTRAYKIIKIDAYTGEPLSMKVKKL